MFKRNIEWQSSLKNSLAFIKIETQALAVGLGVEKNTVKSLRNIPAMVQQFSKKNKNPLIFVKNLDTATYSLRERLKWNAKMAGHLAVSKFKAKTHGLIKK